MTAFGEKYQMSAPGRKPHHNFTAKLKLKADIRQN
jgi:hypothetical protein